MKTNSRNISISVFMALLLAVTSQFARAAESVVFSSGASETTPWSRTAYLLLKEAFSRNGINFDVEYHPSKRSLELSNGGRLDGEMHRIFKFHEVTSGAFPNLMRIDSHITSTIIEAFATKDIAIDDWQDLKTHRIAFNSGRKRTADKLNNLDIKDMLNPVTTEVQAFKMLAAERVDIVISGKTQGRGIIHSSAEFSAIKESGLLDEVKLYPYIHRKHRDLIPALAKTLEKMKQDGTHEKIVAAIK